MWRPTTWVERYRRITSMLSASGTIEVSGDTAAFLPSALRTDRQDRAGSRSNDSVSRGAERPAQETRPPVGAHHDHVSPGTVGVVHDLLLGDPVGEARLDSGPGAPALGPERTRGVLGAPADIGR